MGAQQLGLFGAEEPRCDERYASLRRRELSHGAWIDHAPGWVSGHATLHDHLARTLRWRSGEEHIYDRTVATPRLFAVVPEDGAGHPLLETMRAALSLRYGEQFTRVSLALYRDGRDSVAFHGDRVARELPSALVATVSLGGPRRFLLRPRARGPGFDSPAAPRASTLALNLGWGDLLVMGGSCQRTWQHAIPKRAHAEPRIAIMFRPNWEAA
jgi:alkylated DNA repair dioxygenase AlkB